MLTEADFKPEYEEVNLLNKTFLSFLRKMWIF